MDGAQPLQGQLPQASAHGISDQQRSGQDRHRHGHAGHHRQVSAPVVGQTASGQGDGHGSVAQGSEGHGVI